MSSSSTYSSRVLRARGREAPEGTMWAYRANHFFNYCGHRVSRSMVEKAGHDSLGVYGNHCDKRIFDVPEPRPTRIPTWAESEREEIQVESRYPSSSSSSGSKTAVNTPATESNVFLDDKGKGKIESVSAQFKLEEHISIKHLPDVLIVDDPQGCASFAGDRPSYETRYRLVTAGKPKNSPASTAFLRFSSRRLPSAKNCKLNRASIRLPGSSQELSIMAKLAAGPDLTDARNMLECEASMYATRLPDFLSEDWTGYHYIREAEYDGDGILPVSAVVPKFYGYYVPESRVDTMLLSPILLFEDCGSPVDISRLKQRERETIFSFWHRLHRLNIAHGSISSYSIMVQPGPLHRHPLQRSMSSPSFRLINFGDAVHRKYVSLTEWQAICFEELEKVKDLVYGKFYLKSVPRKLPGYEVRAREYWTEHEDVYRYVERAPTKM